MTFCGETTVTIDTGDHVEAHRLRCRRWQCDDCLPNRLDELRQLGLAGRPERFITLTASTKHFDDPSDMARALVHAWRMVVQRAKREGITSDLQYLAVFEEHKSGFPHLHILVRSDYIPQDWLSKRMDEYCHGPNVWIKSITNTNQIVNYVAKYISKSPHRFNGCKRYWRTQGWQLVDTDYTKSRPLQDRHTLRHNRRIEAVAWSLETNNWRVEWTGENFFNATPFREEQPRPFWDAIVRSGCPPPSQRPH